MKKILLLIPLSFAALLAQGPPPEKNADATPPAAEKPVAPPRLSIEPEGRVLLGSVGPREKKTITYMFTNTSAAPISLRATDLAPGLNVTGPALDKAFAPGEKLGLLVTVDPSGFVGFQKRNIRLVTDDPNQGHYYLPIGMDIRPDLTVDAVRMNFGDVASHESPQQVFTFKRETADPTQIRITHALPPYLDAEVVPTGAKSELRITFRPSKVAPGVELGLEVLQVETNAPMQPAFTLYVEWRLHHAIQPVPNRVVLLDSRLTSADLTLKARDGKPFTITAAEVEGEGFKLKELPKEPSTEQVLTILRTATGEARALLVLHFKNQDQPLKVPLAYLPAPK